MSDAAGAAAETGRLAGKVAFITGAARGQGEQEARIFAAEGARVVLTDVLDDEGAKVAEEIGDNAAYHHLDVTSEEEWRTAVAAAKERFGAIDCLVNNAGILRYNEIVNTPVEEFELVTRVNQIGTFLGIRAVAPEIATGGSIINISSVTGILGVAGTSSYGATKHAIIGLTQVAALELAKKGIRVNAICPGAIDTPMADYSLVDTSVEKGPPGSGRELASFYKRLVPMGRAGLPEEVARLAVFLASDDSSYITGQPFVIDGGWLAGTTLI
ncbi:SDR family NAD(P)-dependent oxidoreductase [Streptomyces sp. NPDC057638]|uniref:SDR family NAD(P)-dependent oxidoreductase n=1 Tax=Streptomyces sp. NPDC057638 TaxID=3346190 RepID=UPI0036C6448E